MFKELLLELQLLSGFPGETLEDFNQLLEAVDKIKFDRLGAFAFSKEEGTPAFDMKMQISEKVKKQRLDTLLSLQKDISLKNNEKYVGKLLEVLIDDISDDNEYFVARSYMDAPDVDGRILIKIDDKSVKNVVVGSFATVKIVAYSQYDLFAEIYSRKENLYDKGRVKENYAC